MIWNLDSVGFFLFLNPVNFQTNFSLKLDPFRKKIIRDAMAKITEQTKWGDQTVINFRERTDKDANYLMFVPAVNVCESSVGQVGGEQVSEHSIRSLKKFTNKPHIFTFELKTTRRSDLQISVLTWLERCIMKYCMRWDLSTRMIT